MSVLKALFVGLESVNVPSSLSGGRDLQSAHTNDLRSALEAMERSSPQLVVVNHTAQNKVPGGCIAVICKRFPDFRAPVVAVDTDYSPYKFFIHEWNAKTERYGTREAYLKSLEKAIKSTIAPPPDVLADLEEKTVEDLDPPVIEALREIGYSNTVARQDISLHIQTEIMVRGELTVKTVIVDGGTILDTIVEKTKTYAGDPVKQFTEIAEAQQNRAVQRVTAGKYDRA